MQFLYLRNCLQLQPVAQIKYFLQLGSIFSLNAQSIREKTIREKTKCRQTVLQISTLCSIIVRGVEAVPILRKNCHPFSPFPLINTSSQMKIFIYWTPPFYYNPCPCLPTVLLINNIYSWNIILKNTGVDIKCFFVNKIFVNKT